MGMFSVPVAAGAVVAAGSAAGAGAAAAEESAGLSFGWQAASAMTANAAVNETNDFACMRNSWARGAHYRKQNPLAKSRPEFVEPLHEGAWIGELGAFGQHRLLIEHQREIAELGRVGALLEIFHEVMPDIELEHRLRVRRLLASRFQHAAQRRRDVVLAGDQHRRGVLETGAH